MPSAGVTIRIDTSGLRRLQEATPRAARQMQEAALDEAYQTARQLVPVRTGFLKRSIRRVREGGKYILRALAHYALYVEYGTRYMAAQPFLRPALEGINWGRIISTFYRAAGLR